MFRWSFRDAQVENPLKPKLKVLGWFSKNRQNNNWKYFCLLLWKNLNCLGALLILSFYDFIERGLEHWISQHRMAKNFRTSKVSFEFITTTTKIRLSMFWFYLWRQKRSQRQKSKYQLPMAYYLWLPRPVGG